MRLKVLKTHALDALIDRASTSKVLDYTRAVPLLDSDCLESSVEATDDVPTLDPERGAALSEAEVSNALGVYRWLMALNELQARDRRLWTWLAHAVFADYCRRRWPLTGSEDAIRRSVMTHWFVAGDGLAGLRRHAIARLWWAAHLTYAPWERDHDLRILRRPDDGHYLKLLFANQDVFQGTFERRFGSDRRVLIPVLAVLDEGGKGRLTSAFVTGFTKEVNLLSKFKELGALPAAQILVQLRSLAGRCEGGRPTETGVG